MSAKEPKDPFDLSELPDLDKPNLGSPSQRADMDLPDLEPLTEASVENAPELPELPDQVEFRPKASSKTPPIDDLPSLPSEAETAPKPGASKAAPKPGASMAPPKPRVAAPSKPAVASAPRPVPSAPKLQKPAAEKPSKPSKPIQPLEPGKPVEPSKPGKPVQPIKPIKPAQPVRKIEPKAAPKPAAPKPAAPKPAAPTPAALEPAVAKSAATEPAAATDAPASRASVAPAEAALPAGERKPDLTPIHLRKAAWIVVLGSMLPWMGSGAGWVTFVAAKATICLGAWLLFQTVRHGAGETVPGVIGKLAAVRWAKPDSGLRNKPVSEQLLGAIPSLGHLLGLVALLGGVAIAFFDPANADDTASILKGVAEVGMLAWAAGTMVHIFAFTHGGKFNPIFPLMFIGMVFAGLLSMIGSFLLEDTLLMVSGVAGSLTVASGGVFACYTIFEAMKQAKVEGEAKKAAAREARKQARSQGGGGKQPSKRGVAPKAAIKPVARKSNSAES